MKPRKYALLFGALMTLGWVGCRDVKDPEFRRIENFRVKSMGLSHATVGFTITYNNPNNFGVSVKEAVALVMLDSVSIGEFRQDSSISVRKSSDFSIPMTGTITLGTIRQLNIPELAFKEIPVQANGTVKVGKAGVYVTKPIQYQGRHRLDIKL
jgi:LEA14-like dessication related protein